VEQVASTQVPPPHAAVAFGYVQTSPHVPQLFGSYEVLVHELPQTCWPLPHVAVQTPLMHA
jgi:hypothetical protein